MPGERRIIEALLDPAHYHFESLALWHFAAAAIVLGCGALVLYWERGSRVSRLFAGFTLLFSLWASGRGLARLIGDPTLQMVIWQAVYALVMLALPLLYQFCVMMLRTDGRRAALIRLNWVIGVVMAVAALATGAIVGGSREFPWGAEPAPGGLGYAWVVWLAGMQALLAVDAVEALRNAPTGTLERQRLALFCAALACLAMGFVDFLPFLGIPVYPSAFVPASVFVALTGWITLRFFLIEVTPELAAQ